MKKSILILILLLTLMLSSSCKFGKKDENTGHDVFALYAKKGSYHAELTYEYYDKQGYAGKTTGNEDYDYTNDITYRNLDGFTGRQKVYVTYDYVYEYDFSSQVWQRSVVSHEDTNSFHGWGDKNNYDFKDGKYVLKKSIDVGQIDFYELYIEGDYLVNRRKVNYGDIWAIITKKYIVLNDDGYVITLPQKYVDKEK